MPMAYFSNETIFTNSERFKTTLGLHRQIFHGIVPLNNFIPLLVEKSPQNTTFYFEYML